jgi:hypothetical protein
MDAMNTELPKPLTPASRSSSEPGGVAIRPLAIPNEHGGWGFLLEPLLMALLVAPSRSGIAIAVAALAAFFMRHPLKFAAGDLILRRKRYPRTGVCAMLAMAYASMAVLALVFAARAESRVLAPIVAVLPFFGVQLYYDMRNRGREWVPELFGALAAGAFGAACMLAAGRGASAAALLWLLAACRAVPAIAHVRALIRRRGFAISMALHAAAAAGIGALVIAGQASPFFAAIYVLLLGRAIYAPFRDRNVRPARIGREEIAWGIGTVVMIVLGFRM